MTGWTVTPSRWTPADRLAALEWQADEDLRCSDCGRYCDESMNPDNEGAYEPESVRCFACKAIHKASASFAGRDDIDPLAGVRWRLTLKEGANGHVN